MKMCPKALKIVHAGVLKIMPNSKLTIKKLSNS